MLSKNSQNRDTQIYKKLTVYTLLSIGTWKNWKYIARFILCDYCKTWVLKMLVWSYYKWSQRILKHIRIQLVSWTLPEFHFLELNPSYRNKKKSVALPYNTNFPFKKSTTKLVRCVKRRLEICSPLQKIFFQLKLLRYQHVALQRRKLRILKIFFRFCQWKM